MDSENLYELLNKVNTTSDNELIFINLLKLNVDVATIWFPSHCLEKDYPTYSGPYRVYLIKAENGNYVSLVIDFKACNLHWYTLKDYRNKGYLSKALKNVILPHLFQDRQEQSITINYNNRSDSLPENSALLAKTIGFDFVKKENNIEEYRLSGKIFDSMETFDPDLVLLTSTRAEILKLRINYYTKNLQILCSELKAKLGQTDQLIEIEEDTKRLQLELSSIIVNAYEDNKILQQ